jgi:hypothetical protein
MNTLPNILQFAVPQSLSPESLSPRPCYSGGPTVITKYDAGSVWLAL